MNQPIIEVKNISKKYNITHQKGGYVALRDVLANIAKRPFSFLKHKAKKITGRTTKEEFWALKDINFTVERGEAIGIIGANGAGKSTLLKILSQITPPTTGKITMRGKIASLLEVGTGFHPELTGRENIFFNGAILGMTKKEIAEKFNAIVKFSGVKKFIDTPVKRYSSGMMVRLGFSVAAHMEPDILLVDEVLAVGDAEFQKKCLGKMSEVTKTTGRTILFVSHNMTAIQNLCKRCILLKEGKIEIIGETRKVIATYLQTQGTSTLELRKDRKGKGNIKLISFFIEDENGKRVNSLITGEYYTFCFSYKIREKKVLKTLSMAMSLSLENGTSLALISTKYRNQDFTSPPQKGIIKCKIEQKFPFTEGLYSINVELCSERGREDYIQNLGIFEVKKGNFYGTNININHSPIYLDQNWHLTT